MHHKNKVDIKYRTFAVSQDSESALNKKDLIAKRNVYLYHCDLITRLLNEMARQIELII